MAWKVELDKSVAIRILKFLYKRVSQSEDPRSIGEALKDSKLGDYWKYRVGDYRIITKIEDGVMKVWVIRIGNRREVYKTR